MFNNYHLINYKLTDKTLKHVLTIYYKAKINIEN